jgi:hypothetical protein
MPRYLVCKMFPAKLSLPVIVLKGMYLNEGHFYNDFSVVGGAFTRPECYHVAASLSGKPKFCFVLENALLGAQGEGGAAKQYQRIEGCSKLEHLMMVRAHDPCRHASRRLLPRLTMFPASPPHSSRTPTVAV